MKDKRTRRKFSTEAKVTFLRRHLVDGVSVSELCEEADIQPSLFYLWQRQMFENLGAAFENPGRPGRRSGQETALSNTVDALKAEVAARDAKLAKKDRVIAEISAEYVALKNGVGEN